MILTENRPKNAKVYTIDDPLLKGYPASLLVIMPDPYSPIERQHYAAYLAATAYGNWYYIGYIAAYERDVAEDSPRFVTLPLALDEFRKKLTDPDEYGDTLLVTLWERAMYVDCYDEYYYDGYEGDIEETGLNEQED